MHPAQSPAPCHEDLLMSDTPRWRIALAYHEYNCATREVHNVSLHDAIAQAIGEADAEETWKRADDAGDPYVAGIHRIEPDGTWTPIPIPPSHTEMAQILIDNARTTPPGHIAIEPDDTGTKHVRNPFRFPDGSPMPMALDARNGQSMLNDRGATLAYLSAPRPLHAPMSQALKAAPARNGIECIDIPLVRSEPRPVPTWDRFTSSAVNAILAETNTHRKGNAIEVVVDNDDILAATVALGQATTRLCELKRAIG